MTRLDIIKRAARNLRRSKGRTILTAMAISVGAFTIALAMAAGEGGRRYTSSLIDGSGDSEVIYVTPKPISDNATEEIPEYGKEVEAVAPGSFKPLGDKDVAKLKAMERVREVVPVYSLENIQYVESSANGKKLVPQVTVKDDKTRVNLVAGSLNDSMPSQGQAVIASEYLKQFGFNSTEEALGKKITVHAEGGDSQKDIELTIAAVDAESDTLVYYKPSIRISAADAATIYQVGKDADHPNEYYGVNVFADSVSSVEALQAEIKQDYGAYSLQDIRSSLISTVSIAQYGLMSFGALALLASVFGIVNTMYISVLERTQQIGLMKALGASRSHVGRLFRYEAAWVGLLGGAIGVGLAWLVTLLNPVIASALKAEAGTKLLVMSPLPVLMLLAGLVLLAVLSGWLPSRRASKLDPIEALRTE